MQKAHAYLFYFFYKQFFSLWSFSQHEIYEMIHSPASVTNLKTDWDFLPCVFILVAQCLEYSTRVTTWITLGLLIKPLMVNFPSFLTMGDSQQMFCI